MHKKIKRENTELVDKKKISINNYNKKTFMRRVEYILEIYVYRRK